MTALAQAVAKGDTSAATATTVSATLAAPPTPGNLLVAAVMCGNALVSSITWGTSPDVTGIATTSQRAYIFSKVAGAGESSTVTATMAVTSTFHRINVYEVSPTAGMTWVGLDQSATNADAGVAVTTLSSGTTPATTSADEFVLAAFSLAATTNTPTMTNGYTVAINVSVATGHLITSATGTQETTATWSVARRAAAAIATYKQGVPSVGNPGAGFLGIL